MPVPPFEASKPQSLLLRSPSRSLSNSSPKSQQSPSTCLLHHRPYSPSKNAGMSGLLPFWLVCSLTRFHSRGTHPKTIAPKLTRPTRLRKYLTQFRFRLSSPCPLQITGNHPCTILRRKSSPMLRLDSLNFPLPTGKILVSVYVVFLDLPRLR